ncbi:MAG: efflux transporter periplasmic adaptor subunit [Mucilaginibacter sp.]|nr:efflux transporter periplasmic adaptor subunit [Mucilaginibacter sp.]
MKNISMIKIGLIVAIVVLFSACSNPKPVTVATTQEKSIVKYTCPMHPQIMEDHPGSCPICGMNLVKKSGEASESAGISLNTVLQPVNSTVITSIKAISPEERTVPTEIKAQGYLDFDTRTFNNISARFSGRIEKLYIKYAFQEIHAGQRIFDIYSPEMISAQQDLLYLQAHSAQETELINAAKQKLLLMGMTNAQINQVLLTKRPLINLPVYSPYEGHVHDMSHSQMANANNVSEPTDFNTNLPLSAREGMYVEKGQNIFNIVDPHKLWAVIKIDRSSMINLKLNQQVMISLPDVPGKTINGKVNFIEPVLQQGDKTVSIRVYIDNMEHELKVNSLISATIQTGISKGLWIPRSAVIDLGQTKVVWLKTDGLYKAHQVIAGTQNGNEIEIVKGLSLNDHIAADAQYLTDSESFIKTKDNE